ncbi:MAG: hypothetical protein GXY83_34170 [Rhodopirellula sp.]|nr:hypothetical protein [Rhodopirellula sp.]
MTPKKPCGPCTACCTVFTVVEFDKPRHTPCQHLCATGCSIHDQPRPATCTDFFCDWTLSDWGDELRPDRCGVIYVTQSWIDPHHKLIGGLMSNPYAYLSRVSKKHIERLVRAGHVLLLTWEDEEGVEYHPFFERFRYPALNVDIIARSLKDLNKKALSRVRAFYENRSTTGGK